MFYQIDYKILNMFTLGPAALLSTFSEVTGKEFPYKGYKTMCYTDKSDEFMPTVGYLPGPMPWFLGEKLDKLGVEVG